MSKDPALNPSQQNTQHRASAITWVGLAHSVKPLCHPQRVLCKSWGWFPLAYSQTEGLSLLFQQMHTKAQMALQQLFARMLLHELSRWRWGDLLPWFLRIRPENSNSDLLMPRATFIKNKQVQIPSASEKIFYWLKKKKKNNPWEECLKKNQNSNMIK